MAHANSMDDGREAMFREMMERFTEVQNRYKGVRGELLAKVRTELEALAPEGVHVAGPVVTSEPVAKQTPPPPPQEVVAKQTPPPAPKATPNAPPPAPVSKVVTTGMLPSCRSCGGTMKESGDGSLVCARGHVRQIAS